MAGLFEDLPPAILGAGQHHGGEIRKLVLAGIAGLGDATGIGLLAGLLEHVVVAREAAASRQQRHGIDAHEFQRHKNDNQDEDALDAEARQEKAAQPATETAAAQTATQATTEPP